MVLGLCILRALQVEFSCKFRGAVNGDVSEVM